jgi:hypothetical protein
MALYVRGGTLESLEKEGLPLYATCQHCNHVSQLNIQHLGQTLGWKMM